MEIIEIENKLINLDKIHFIRKNSENELLISFGTDFLKFTGSANYIDNINSQIKRRFNLINKKRNILGTDA